MYNNIFVSKINRPNLQCTVTNANELSRIFNDYQLTKKQEIKGSLKKKHAAT